VNKAQVEKILVGCSGLTAGRTALTLYIILTWIASDKGDVASFTISQTAVAKKAGLSERAVRNATNALCTCGVLSYKVKSFGGIGTWTLLSPPTLTEKRPPEPPFRPPPAREERLPVPTYKERKEKKGNPSRIITEEQRKANLESMKNFRR
jgi:hypothetical protein